MQIPSEGDQALLLSHTAGDFVNKLTGRNVERLSNTKDNRERRSTQPTFEQTDVGTVDAATHGYIFLFEIVPDTKFAQQLSERFLRACIRAGTLRHRAEGRGGKRRGKRLLSLC